MPPKRSNPTPDFGCFGSIGVQCGHQLSKFYQYRNDLAGTTTIVGGFNPSEKY